MLNDLRIKLDVDDVPAPTAITDEGFYDFVGTATIGDVVLEYPLEAPLVRQYIPAEEILSDAALASIAHKPIVNSHPRDALGRRTFVTPANASQVTRGIVKRAWRDDTRTKMKVDLRVFDATLLEDIRAGKIDLSTGSDCDTVAEAGVTPDGRAYDAVQRNHRYNHVAVERRGRNPGARLTADGQDSSMDEIKALIASGKISPEQAKELMAELAKLSGMSAAGDQPVDDAGDPIAALTAKVDGLAAKVAALEAAANKPPKADGADLSDAVVTKLAAKLTPVVVASAATGLRSIQVARDRARPILGAAKTDSVDDAAALDRDVVIAVFPDQRAEAEADYAAGKADVLARGAQMARATHNRQRTSDAADRLLGGGNSGTPAPATREAQEKSLAEALDKKAAN